MNFLLRCLLCGILVTSLAWAQSPPPLTRGSRTISTAVPFLGMEDEARSTGFGRITAVAPLGYYATGLDGNPATLAQGSRSFGGYTTISPRFSAIPEWSIQLGGWLPLNESHTLGIQANAFSYDGDFWGEPSSGSGWERNLGLRYALVLSPMVSMGIGFNFFQSYLHFPRWTAPSRTLGASADWGLWLHRENHSTDLGTHWQVGLSVQDLGPKLDYPLFPANRNPTFIPTRLKLGGLFGFQFFEALDLDLAYQAQKMLVPSVGANQETGAIAGAFQSFADSPEGLVGEWREVRHHLGLEIRWRAEGWWLAARIGYTYEHEFVGSRQTLDFGASVGYRGIRFDGGVSYRLNSPTPSFSSLTTFGLVCAFGN